MQSEQNDQARLRRRNGQVSRTTFSRLNEQEIVEEDEQHSEQPFKPIIQYEETVSLSDPAFTREVSCFSTTKGHRTPIDMTYKRFFETTDFADDTIIVSDDRPHTKFQRKSFESAVVVNQPQLKDSVPLDQTANVIGADSTCQAFVNEWKLMAHSALPEWLKDNDYIVSSHRPPLPCFLSCFKTVFSIHSETVNIWTHLVGSLIILAIMCYFYVHPDVSTYSWQRILVFSVFFLAAALCMTLSWVFHTFLCHSYEMNLFFCKLDYSGIAILCVGSFVPWLYYGFYCDHDNMVFYMSLLTVLSSACCIFSLMKRFGTPVYRPIRAIVFLALGMSGAIPVIHVIFNLGIDQSIVKVSLLRSIGVALLYICGAIVYALRIPERFFPGKVDIWGHSHQLLHVLVVSAAVLHYTGIRNMAEHRRLIGECSVVQ